MKKLIYPLILVVVGLFSCEEKCEEDTSKLAACLCTYEYNPVCGCNEKTYGNACEAECHGIEQYSEGACGKKGDS